MSSHEEFDIMDYFDDNANDEDRASIPVESTSGPDSWSGFFGGVLTGIAGAALIPVGAWVGGALVALGYGFTGWTLRRSPNRFVRAFSFGFFTAAIAGTVLAAGDFIAPHLVSSFVDRLGSVHMIFVTLFAMPWAAGALRYAHLLRTAKREPAAILRA